uniref:Putative ixodegrin protein n=1 Tax=Ixodes ricinus TaxID=34613 RepID=A0A0K8RF60_IXORI
MNAAFIAALLILGTLELDGVASDAHIVLRPYCESRECTHHEDCKSHPLYPPCDCIPSRADDIKKYCGYTGD